MFTRAGNRRFEGLERCEMVEEYTFIQLADPQFGLLGATKDAQWLRNFRCLVESLTFGLNDGKETIPVPIIHPRHQKQTAEELYQVEMDLADRAVSYHSFSNKRCGLQRISGTNYQHDPSNIRGRLWGPCACIPFKRCSTERKTGADV